MNGSSMPLIPAILIAGCVMSILYGYVVHWVPIVLAIVVATAITGTLRR